MLLRVKTFPVPFLILVSFYSHLPAYENGTECSETSAYKIQTLGNYPKEGILYISVTFCGTSESVSLGLHHILCLLRRRLSDVVITSIRNTESDDLLIVRRICKL